MGGDGCVHLITSQEDWKAKLQEASAHGKLMISNFTATWSSPCETIASHFQVLSTRHPHALFLSIDVEQMPDLADEYDIQAIPTFVFIRNGKKIGRQVGANIHDLEKRVAQHATKGEVKMKS